MQEQLSKLESVLADKPNSIEEMLLKIKQDQAETDKMKETLSSEEKVVSKQAEEVEKLWVKAQNELDGVLLFHDEVTIQPKELSSFADTNVR